MYTKSVTISLRADFSWGRHFNVTLATRHSLTSQIAVNELQPAEFAAVNQ